MARKLSILVPVYNEVATVEQLVHCVAVVPFPIDREIVVVDDGSSDGSREILVRLAETNLITFVGHESNRGKGAAVQTALQHARGDVVVVQDADLELDPNDLPALLEPILSGDAEVCYGSRFMSTVPGSMRCMPTYWVNRVLNALSNLLNGINITDFNTCYKMVTTEVMSKLGIAQNGFAMEPEITAKIARLGYRIVERPVHYHPRTFAGGKKIRALDLFKYLAVMFRYRFFWSGVDSSRAHDLTVEPDPVARLGTTLE